MIKTVLKSLLFCCVFPVVAHSQTQRNLNLTDALKLGLTNSKNLKLAQYKIDESIARMAAVKDNALPSATASFLYNHAEIATNKLQTGGGNPIYLPQRADAFVGTAALQEVVYAGGKYKYAQESTKLLVEAARLDAEKNKEEISYAIINTYFSLYKLLQSKKVVAQNLESIANQLQQSERFFEQGIVTKNDVLRFQLQQANVTLTGLEIDNNRRIVNYNLGILLGLSEDTEIVIAEENFSLQQPQVLSGYLADALSNRQELQQTSLNYQVSAYNIKSIKANQLPIIGLAANAYYVNPSGNFIPSATQFIAPVTVGATVSWNIASLWNNKNKVSEAKIQQQEIAVQKEVLTDQIKTELNRNYQNYVTAVKKIDILQASIAQATENDRLLASKYKNNIASVTERIDAETLLYQAKINLELAKADARLAYYALLKSTGRISKY